MECFIGERLQHVYQHPATVVRLQKRPNATLARTGEQPQLSVTALAPQEVQHPLRVGAIQPLGLGHRLTLTVPPGLSLTAGLPVRWVSSAVAALSLLPLWPGGYRPFAPS